MPNTLSPNMSLILPTVGQEPSPTWSSDLNSSLSIIDQHNHSAGAGVPITPSGISLTSDLSFLSNNAVQLRSVRFIPQSSPLTGSLDLGCLYENGVDLFYNDGNGTQIRITQSGGIVGTPGSIGGLVPPASVTYVSATPAFVFQSNVNTAANLDGGSITLRNIVLNSKGITINPPASLPANYSITLPSNPPASIKIMTMDSSGNIGVTYDTDNVTLQVSSSLLGIIPKSVGVAQLTDHVITGTQLTNNITLAGTLRLGGAGGTLLSDSNLSGFGVDALLIQGGGSLSGGVQFNTPGGAIIVEAPSVINTVSVVHGTTGVRQNVVTSYPSSSDFGLNIVRGTIDTSGGIVSGEGFTSVRNGAGNYTITFIQSFGDSPSVVITPVGSFSSPGIIINAINSGSVTYQFTQLGGPTDITVNFIAMGLRGGFV